MDPRYSIKKIYICPFVYMGGLNIMPDLYFPPRLCVIDNEEKIAIDIELELKYEYLESSSRLYLNSMIDKIKSNKRFAISTLLCVDSFDDSYNKGLKIIEQLKQGKKFQDGNELLTNKEYLIYIRQEKEIENKKLRILKKERKK